MALTLRHWITAGLLGCATISVALLPPRENPDRSPVAPPRTARRQIADALNHAYHAALYLERRDEALRALAPALRRSGTAPLTLVVDPRRTHAIAAPRVRAIGVALDSLIPPLATEGSGVRVGVFVTTDTGYGTPAGYVRFNGPLYVVPDAIDGRTCLVILPISSRAPVRSASTMLGLCAFYAAFGRPGPDIERWLALVGHAVAQEADWRRTPPPIADLDVDEALRFAEWWEILQRSATLGMSIDARACAVGKLVRCRDLIESPSGVPYRRSVLVPGLVQKSWWTSWDGREWYLADLVRETGHDRFGRFWRSPLSRDSAFATAFGLPMNQWTSRWLRQTKPRVTAGPVIRGSSVLLGLMVAVALVAGGAYYVARREVG